ncbi:MAG: ABC transporter ATP-binding protein [Bacillota bacterium]|nr:ABC transporter ATP-binding protein [Bacillota bacterium]
MLAIETSNLTKTYQGMGGCRDISLAVPTGSIFGLLGPNGAGKSTLVKMLVGLLHPTSGEAKVLNRPIQDVLLRKKVGFLPENFRYHDWLSGEDLLQLHGRLFGLSAGEISRRIPEVLHMVGLTPHGHKQVGSYSKGMQQRIGLGCALLPDPDLLFLDEPTSALDPIGRKVVRDLMVSLQERGKTIFLNSHLLSELETVCDHIAIIREGTLLYQGNWRQLTARDFRLKVVIGGHKPELNIDNVIADTAQLISKKDLGRCETGKRQELLIACAGEQYIPLTVRKLTEAGFDLYEITPITDSLEKLFLQYVSGNGDAEGR